MDENLNTLIKYYEEEKSNLLQLIDDFVKEQEYEFADYHSKALRQVNYSLQTLYNIDDRLYDEKAARLKNIAYMEKLMESESSELMKKSLTKIIQTEKDGLDKLNQLPKLNFSFGNATIFKDTLKNLVDKEIKNFNLILNKADNLILKFSYHNKKLKVTLPFVKQHIKKYILHDDTLNKFLNLGFMLTDNNCALILRLTGKKEAVIDKLKIIISKIVFEVFWFKSFDNESYIQITDKDRR
ncbi:MAG TPA: hypothetical protein VNV85_00145 [Puia sp.]|nr:hypothetical protein [Puia sp.]